MKTYTKALGNPLDALSLVGAVLVLIATALLPDSAYAVFAINSQGTSGAPISVTNSVAKVLDCVASRTQWLICPETVAIRCTLGPVAAGCGVASPAPSTTVGFYIAAGSCWKGDYPANQGTTNVTGIMSAEVDCESTGAATNVDTVEFP